MQVSWIEPDEIRALAALLQGAHPGGGTTGGWDVQTLPDAPQPPPQPLLSQEPEPRSAPEATAAASTPVQAQAQPQPPQPSAEVVLIREKLRVIRDRAKQAGLIQDEPPAVIQPPPAPAVPLDAPMAPEAPSQISQFPPLSSLRPTVPAPSTAPAFHPLEGAITERLENFAQWATKFTGCSELLLLDDHGDLLWGTPSHPDLVVASMLAVQQTLRASAGSIQQPPNALSVTVEESSPAQVLPCSTRHGLVTLVLGGIAPLAEGAVTVLREALVLSVEAGGS